MFRKVFRRKGLNEVTNKILKRQYLIRPYIIPERIIVKKEELEKKPISNRIFSWEKITSIIAILLSIFSLVITVISENAKATGNIQLLESNGYREYDFSQLPVSVKIFGGIKLKNIGNAPIQIVDVRWESTISSVKNREITGWLAISDFLDPTDTMNDDYFSENKSTPISAIRDSIVDRGKILELKYSSIQFLPDDFDVQDPSIRIIFTLSNGQQIVVLPLDGGIGGSTGIGTVSGGGNASGDPIDNDLEIQKENLSVVEDGNSFLKKPSPTAIFTLSPKCFSSYSKKPLLPELQKTNDFPRYTISMSSLEVYLYQMSINDLCVPEELGYPYINADWNELVNTAENGRLISIGFDKLYNEKKWSKIFLLYSTFDFKGGRDFDPIMTEVDWENYRNNDLTYVEKLKNGKGFVHYLTGFGKDDYPIYKAYVYPQENGYVALVINLGNFSGSLNDEMQKIKNWDLPIDDYKWLPVFERFVGSLRFFESFQQ